MGKADIAFSCLVGVLSWLYLNEGDLDRFLSKWAKLITRLLFKVFVTDKPKRVAIGDTDRDN